MKTRIIQRDPEPDRPHNSGNGAAVPPPPPAHNLAARMARWSGAHRKKAIFGWLAFVLVVFYVGNNVVVQKDISDVDQYSGEARDAEQALEDAGMRPTEEVVFVQSDELTIEDPEFQAAVEDVTGRISQIRYVENVESPLTGDGDVSADGHAALVGFEIAGDSTETKDRVAPTLDAVAAVQADHPDLAIEQVGGASANEGIDKVIKDDLGKAGMLSIPITLIILIITFGTLVAAGLPLLIGLTSVMAALGMVSITSQLLPADTNLPAVVLLIGLAVGVRPARQRTPAYVSGRSSGCRPRPGTRASPLAVVCEDGLPGWSLCVGRDRSGCSDHPARAMPEARGLATLVSSAGGPRPDSVAVGGRWSTADRDGGPRSLGGP